MFVLSSLVFYFRVQQVSKNRMSSYELPQILAHSTFHCRLHEFISKVKQYLFFVQFVHFRGIIFFMMYFQVAPWKKDR